MIMSNKINSLSIDGVTYDIDTYDIYNALDYGCYNDDIGDNYTPLQALFDIIYAKGKSAVVYFPSGKYNISKGVIIPPNTTIIGQGATSYLFGTTEVSRSGVFLGASGSNITVKNLRVGYVNDNREFLGGSNQGAIGISTYEYENAKNIMTTGVVGTAHVNCTNLLIENIYSTSAYPLQVETARAGGTYKKITYRNIYAPNGCISFTQNADYQMSDITIENVTCAFLRCGWGYKSDNVSVNNCTCNAFKVGVSGIKINNVYVDGDRNSHYFGWSAYNNISKPYIDITGENAVINNLVVNRHGNSQRAIQYTANIIMNNVHVYNSLGDEYSIVTTNNAKIIGSNIIADGKNLVLGNITNSKIENNNERVNKISDFDIPNITFTGEFVGATGSFSNSIYVKDDVLYLKTYYASGESTPVNTSLFTINDTNLRPKTTKQVPCTIWDNARQSSHLGWFKFEPSGDVSLIASGGLFTGRNYIMCDGFIHLG